MGRVKFMVHGARRWRELDLQTGRVDGWGPVKFVVVQRGRLNLEPRVRVLRALRALAAGERSAARDGPRLSQIRIDTEQRDDHSREVQHIEGEATGLCCRLQTTNGATDANFNSIPKTTKNQGVQCQQMVSVGVQATPSPSPTAALGETSQTDRNKPSHSDQVKNNIHKRKDVTKSKQNRKDVRESNNNENVHSRSRKLRKSETKVVLRRRNETWEAIGAGEEQSPKKHNKHRQEHRSKGKSHKRSHVQKDKAKDLSHKKKMEKERKVTRNAEQENSQDDRRNKENGDVQSTSDSVSTSDSCRSVTQNTESDKSEATDETQTENSTFKELLITEDVVDLLGDFLTRDRRRSLGDPQRYYHDLAYRAELFYRLNPTVSLQRCPRVGELLRRRQRAFAATLGLRHVPSDGEDDVTARPARPLRPRPASLNHSTSTSRSKSTTHSTRTKETGRTRNLTPTHTKLPNPTRSSSSRSTPSARSSRKASSSHTKSPNPTRSTSPRSTSSARPTRKALPSHTKSPNTTHTKLPNTTRTKSPNTTHTKSPNPARSTSPRSTPSARSSSKASPSHTKLPNSTRSPSTRSTHKRSIRRTPTPRLTSTRSLRRNPSPRVTRTKSPNPTSSPTLRPTHTSSPRHKPSTRPTRTLSPRQARSRAARKIEKGTIREYSEQEDAHIVRWLRAEGRARLVNGNRVWWELPSQHAAATGVTRTWQSLRNRYLRYLLPSLGALELPPEEATRLRASAAAGVMRRLSPARTHRPVLQTASNVVARKRKMLSPTPEPAELPVDFIRTPTYAGLSKRYALESRSTPDSDVQPRLTPTNTSESDESNSNGSDYNPSTSSEGIQPRRRSKRFRSKSPTHRQKSDRNRRQTQTDSPKVRGQNGTVSSTDVFNQENRKKLDRDKEGTSKENQKTKRRSGRLEKQNENPNGSVRIENIPNGVITDERQRPNGQFPRHNRSREKLADAFDRQHTDPDKIDRQAPKRRRLYHPNAM
ncbi:serine/arginine repetitive matrix protein 5 [Bicyclus anynana]|uniref:Serine/arginine repetitive matrix protein 5 n=1 Tax=Bicyclus anynana TaxID=110368 RepID=A0ABM3M3I9_BICAN|nr:serine/arginine repetitive matrix protein 5 [Bicyclus anynana]